MSWLGHLTRRLGSLHASLLPQIIEPLAPTCHGAGLYATSRPINNSPGRPRGPLPERMERRRCTATMKGDIHQE